MLQEMAASAPLESEFYSGLRIVAELTNTDGVHCSTADMSIFADSFIMASDNGTLIVLRQGHSMTSLSGIHDVGVLGFDWLTDTLYWTNSKLNTVCIISFPAINFAINIVK